jgi:hypothetical protein
MTDRLIKLETLERVVNMACSCGGKGPNDDGVCPACMVWHLFNRAAESQIDEIKPNKKEETK